MCELTRYQEPNKSSVNHNIVSPKPPHLKAPEDIYSRIEVRPFLYILNGAWHIKSAQETLNNEQQQDAGSEEVREGSSLP